MCELKEEKHEPILKKPNSHHPHQFNQQIALLKHRYHK